MKEETKVTQSADKNKETDTETASAGAKDNTVAHKDAEKNVFKKLGGETRKGIKSFIADFKKFINKGNVFNLAVALVIGTAFTKIVSSLVNDLIMPLVSILFGKTSLTEHKWVVSERLTISWGSFVLAVIEFLIIALFLFFIVKAIMNAQNGIKRLSKKTKKAIKNGETSAVSPPPEEAKAETDIDILKDIRALLEATAGVKRESGTQNEAEAKKL